MSQTARRARGGDRGTERGTTGLAGIALVCLALVLVNLIATRR